VDETYLKVAGRWTYLYRAVDQYGQVVDVLVSTHRDTAAARHGGNDHPVAGAGWLGRA
jgi:IS6 family transposase